MSLCLDQPISTSSPSQTVTLYNKGSAALNLTSVTASGNFAVTNNCGAGLGAGGSCSFSVNFTPTASGTRTGSIAITSNATGSPHSVALSGIGVTANYAVTVTKAGTGLGTVSSPAGSGLYCGALCSVTYASGTSVTLMATATTGSTFIGWGGDCSGTATTCTVSMSQARSVTASFTLGTVPSVPGQYDGIYQWDTGYYLSVHQNAGTLIGSIYWVYTGNSEQVGSRSIPEADTFDLFSGAIVGPSATMTGTRFYRACQVGYDFTFNSDSSLTVLLNSVNNSPGVNAADVNCAARFNPVGSAWTIPRIY